MRDDQPTDTARSDQLLELAQRCRNPVVRAALAAAAAGAGTEATAARRLAVEKRRASADEREARTRHGHIFDEALRTGWRPGDPAVVNSMVAELKEIQDAVERLADAECALAALCALDGGNGGEGRARG